MSASDRNPQCCAEKCSREATGIYTYTPLYPASRAALFICNEHKAAMESGLLYVIEEGLDAK